MRIDGRQVGRMGDLMMDRPRALVGLQQRRDSCPDAPRPRRMSGPMPGPDGRGFDQND